MSVELAIEPNSSTPWQVRLTIPPPWRTLPYVAEVTGRDDTYRYQRRFCKDTSLEEIQKGIRRYAFRVRPEPYLLDIRHETRNYYVLHQQGNSSNAQLDEIPESLLAELLVARELWETGIRPLISNGIWNDLEPLDKKTKDSIRKTLLKAAMQPRDPAVVVFERPRVVVVQKVIEKTPEKTLPTVVSRQSIRRVHFD